MRTLKETIQWKLSQGSRSVKTGTTVELPKVTRKGYEVRWVTEINGKQRRYLPGQSVTIRQNTKFCLKLYKLYTVSFYTANGKKEYKNLRQTVVAGGRIKCRLDLRIHISVPGLVNKSRRSLDTI